MRDPSGRSVYYDTPGGDTAGDAQAAAPPVQPQQQQQQPSGSKQSSFAAEVERPSAGKSALDKLFEQLGQATARGEPPHAPAFSATGAAAPSVGANPERRPAPANEAIATAAPAVATPAPPRRKALPAKEEDWEAEWEAEDQAEALRPSSSSSEAKHSLLDEINRLLAKTSSVGGKAAKAGGKVRRRKKGKGAKGKAAAGSVAADAAKDDFQVEEID